jgi:metal-responsive CopG/Arc/MetJ family transcriptional regulator
MKVPFNISLDDELANWIKYIAERDKPKIRNRSHLIEMALIKMRKEYK